MVAILILTTLGGLGVTIAARRIDRAAMRRGRLTEPQERVVRHLCREMTTMLHLGWPLDQALGFWERAIRYYTPAGPVRDTRIRLAHTAYSRIRSGQHTT